MDFIFFSTKGEPSKPRSTASHSKLLMLIKGHVNFTVPCHLKLSWVNIQISRLTVHVSVTVRRCLRWDLSAKACADLDQALYFFC